MIMSSIIGPRETHDYPNLLVRSTNTSTKKKEEKKSPSPRQPYPFLRRRHQQRDAAQPKIAVNAEPVLAVNEPNRAVGIQHGDADQHAKPGGEELERARVPGRMSHGRAGGSWMVGHGWWEGHVWWVGHVGTGGPCMNGWVGQVPRARVVQRLGAPRIGAVLPDVLLRRQQKSLLEFLRAATQNGGRRCAGEPRASQGRAGLPSSSFFSPPRLRPTNSSGWAGPLPCQPRGYLPPRREPSPMHRRARASA